MSENFDRSAKDMANIVGLEEGVYRGQMSPYMRRLLSRWF